MRRQIVEQQKYREQIDALRVDWQRLDDALSELGNAACNTPEIFPLVPGTKLRRIGVVGFPGVPSLAVFFFHTEEQVIIHAAELIESD